MNGELKEVPVEFQEIVERFGRDMFAFIYNDGMLSVAQMHLKALTQKHCSTKGYRALMVLVETYEELAHQLIAAKGWTEAELRECEQAILTVVKTRIEVLKILTH